MRIITCITQEHHWPTLLLAVLVCMIGCIMSMRLIKRSYQSEAFEKIAWLAMGAVCIGASMWSTHFIAMMAYRPDATASLDLTNTLLSALIIFFGAPISCYLISLKARYGKTLAGALMGLSIAGMHYKGMLAYNVDALVMWDMGYVLASIVACIFFAALALELPQREDKGAKRFLPAVFLALSILSVHFIGIAGYQIIPATPGEGLDPLTNKVLTYITAFATLIVISVGAAGYAVEAGQRERSDNKLRHMALHDSVTGLPNRACFLAMLDQALISSKNTHFAVIMIDLNRFKEINDAWGHHAGDAVLTDIAERLKRYNQTDSVVARLGGDEFAIMLPVENQTHLENELRVIERLFQAPVRRADFKLITGASLGVAVYPEDGEDRETLIRNADLAMYKAKADPLNAVHHYEKALGEAVRKRRELVHELRVAIETDQLEMHYQPQIMMETGEIAGYEALLRWPHPERGMVPPGEFVPLAEANGLIGKLGDWVLKRACMEAAQWDNPVKVAVNVSALQLGDPNLEQKVLQALIDSGLSVSRLELELTETALIHDLDQSLSVLRRLKALGISVALDDFGTGYSALETLRRFPFDKIKLDQSFTDGLRDGGRSCAVMSAVVTLAENLSIPVLAEGVETLDQLDALQKIGCEQAQGFLIGRPGPSRDNTPPDIAQILWSPPEAEDATLNVGYEITNGKAVRRSF